MVTIKLVKNPGTISYKLKKSLISPNGLTNAIQTITTTAPEIIPLTAPVRLKPFQYKLIITSGPNAAPKPAQALPTRFKIVSLGDHALIIETIATKTTDIRHTKSKSFSCFFAASSPPNNL